MHCADYICVVCADFICQDFKYRVEGIKRLPVRNLVEVSNYWSKTVECMSPVLNSCTVPCACALDRDDEFGSNTSPPNFPMLFFS